MNARWALSVLLLSLALGATSALSPTQVTTGSIQGTVKDEQRAVVPGVMVTVRNVGTGVTRSLTTDAQGRYQAANLDLGGYEVRAEMSGFQTAVRTGITLTIGAVAWWTCC